jgi:hypothetical protein
MAEYGSGMLDEHQAPERDKSQPTETYEPTPEERKAIKLVNKLLDKAKKHRAMYDKDWLDFYRLFRGKQWKESRPSYRHSEVINLIFRAIQSAVPIQVDARPRVEYIAEEPSDQEVAAILEETVESDWIRSNWGMELLEIVYDSNIYGTGMSCTKGEPNKVDYHSVDPVYCYPDPEARDVDKQCSYFCYAEPIDVARIKRQWPDKAEFIRADLQELEKASRAQDDVRFRSPADRNMVMEGSTPLDPANKDLALVVTCYLTAEMCQDDFDEEESEGPDGNPVYVQIAKYPKGRRIIICNNVVLEDGPNPYDDGEIPYERYPNYVMSREFWGMSEIEQLKGPQRIFNKMVSFALDVLTLMGNPVWMVPTSSGVDPDTLVNRPGLNIEYDGDTPPRREEGVQLQPYVLQMIDKMAEWFDSIAGSQDVTRGVNPTGVTAASAITSLQEAAQTRIRQKARNMDYYLQKVGQHYYSRVMQFYSAPRIVRLTNNQNATKYFRMHIETTPNPDGTQSRVLKKMPYTNQGLEDPTQYQEFPIKGSFDVRVSTGSTLPFAKAEKEQKLLNLFDRGIVDAEEVLKGTDYPNWQAVLARIQQQQAQAAQAQAAAKGGGSAPPAQGVA